jgi:glycosyltransferase involved in cell wall biosynthesis
MYSRAVDVLFLSPDFLYPADRGLRVRSFAQLRVLSSMDAVRRITLLSLCETEVDAARLSALEHQIPKLHAEPVVVQPTHMRRSPRHVPRLLRLRLQGLPYLIAKCDTPKMHALVNEQLTRFSYDVVYVGQLGMAAYLRRARRLAPKARFVLEEHNVEWEIFRRLAPTFRLALREIARVEARALRRFERRTLRSVDSTIAISDADAQVLRRLGGRSVEVVPTFIERKGGRVESTKAPALAYTGLLAWQPNAHGLDWFCRDVWPLVRRDLPEATLTIAGPGLRRAADGTLAVPEAWSLPGIRTVGYVDDLESLYKDSLAIVAPILGGSGVRMKLLESMRAGMPTVTTTDGAAGLDVKDGQEMLIADDPARFAQGVVRLLNDAGLRERLRTGGYAYLENHHSLVVARARLAQALVGAS